MFLLNKHYLAYAAPVVAKAWLIAPIGIVQGIYAKYYGISLSAIAFVVLASRIFDAISDPVVGYYSDSMATRTNSRKRNIILGSGFFVVSGFSLYSPPEYVGTAYFATCFIAFYLSWTMFEIPHMAWGAELATHSKDKTTLFGYRAVAGYLGLVIFYSIPLLPFFETQDITPETLEISVIMASLLMLPLMLMAIKQAPDGVVRSYKTIAKKSNWLEVKSLSRSLYRNKPFLIFMAAYLLIGASNSMWMSLIFIYVDSYLDMGHVFAQIFLLAFVVGMVATPIWAKLSNLYGKRLAWLLATFLIFISYVYTGILTQDNVVFSDLVIIKIVQTLGFACIFAIAPSMLSDVIDYTQWKFDSDKSATYFAIFTFLSKSNMAFGAFTALLIAGSFGFDASSTDNSDSSISGLLMAIAWIPSVLIVAGAAFVVAFPLSARRHAIVDKALRRKALRLLSPEIASTVGERKHVG